MSSASTPNPPTTRDIRIFAVLLSLFGLALAWMVMRRPGALTGAAIFLIVAWSLSLALNADHRRRVLLSAALPIVMALLATLLRTGAPPRPIAAVLVIACGVAAAVSAVSPRHGRMVYDGWMRAAEPIGWSVATVVLTSVYYLAFVPIGLLMRLAGHDPMKRTLDKQADSYWVQRPPPAEKARYFRQF